MRHLKRPALLGLLLLACLLLAGCQMDSTVEELFTLPRLPTEYTTLSRQLDHASCATRPILRTIVFIIIIKYGLCDNIINNIQQLYKKQENDCMSLSSSLFARLSTVASRLSSNKVSVAEHSPQISMPTTRSFRRTIASNSSSSCRLKDP